MHSQCRHMKDDTDLIYNHLIVLQSVLDGHIYNITLITVIITCVELCTYFSECLERTLYILPSQSTESASCHSSTSV